MTIEAEALLALSEKASKGPWVADTERSDGSYGSGEDTYEGYDTAVILTEAETLYGKPGVLFESHNSTVGSIHEESNEEDFRAWDAVSEANAAFIIALVNAYRSGSLINRSALAEDTARAAEGMRERAEKAEAGLAEAIAAIAFCEAIDDHYEAREFLKGWSEGDTSEWPEFVVPPALPLDKEAAHANR